MITVSEFIAQLTHLMDIGEIDPHSEIAFVFDSENPETSTEFFVIEEDNLDAISFYGDSNQTVVPVHLDQRNMDDFGL